MNYGAITIDTSIFDKYGNRLDQGLLKALEQFRGKPVRFILSEIVVRELIDHMERQVVSSVASMERAIKDARSYLGVDVCLPFELLKLMETSSNLHEVAKQRLAGFIERAGVIVISAGYNVDVQDLVRRYFSSEPPFSDGKKKNEFPDAIALLSLEAYAKENDFKVLAVSLDSDWEKFCSASNWVDISKDLAEAVAVFQPQNDAVDMCVALAKELSQKEEAFNEIASQVEDHVSDLEFLVDADSQFHWDLQSMYIKSNELYFEEERDGLPVLNPVRIDDGRAIIETKIGVKCTVEAEFALSVRDGIDKDYVSMGIAVEQKEMHFTCGLLFTVHWDLTSGGYTFDISDVDVTNDREVVSFGYLEPEWWKGDGKGLIT